MSATAEARAVKRLSHQDQILALLQQAGPKGCTTMDLLAVSHRFGGRIFDLRKRGWDILTLDLPGTDCCKFILQPSLNLVPQPDLVERVPPAQPSAPPMAGLCECGHVAGMHRRSLEKSGLYLCVGCDCMDFRQQ